MGFLSASSPKIILHCQSPLQQGPLILKQAQERRKETWNCVICAHSSNPSSASKCLVCGVQNMALQEGPSRGRTRTSVKTEVKKPCPKCTLMNHVDLAFCEMCEAPLSSTTDTKGSMAASLNGELYIVKLSFRGGGQPAFLKLIQKTLGDKAWEVSFLLQHWSARQRLRPMEEN